MEYWAHMLDEAFGVGFESIDQNDEIEKQVWQKCKDLPRDYGYSSVIWQWYCKDKKSMSREELR